jgi:hypothetical protein
VGAYGLLLAAKTPRFSSCAADESAANEPLMRRETLDGTDGLVRERSASPGAARVPPSAARAGPRAHSLQACLRGVGSSIASGFVCGGSRGRGTISAMQPRKFSVVNGRFQLDDYAGATKVVVVPGQPAQRLADLSLHMRDLQQVLEWVAALGRIPPDLDPGPAFTIRRGLWYSMVVNFCKCFGASSGRGQLDPKAVFKGYDALLDDYRYFDDLRNKNFVHDQNTMSQAFTLAAIPIRQSAMSEEPMY